MRSRAFALALAALALAGCGGDDGGDAGSETKTVTATEPAASDPLACLERAGLEEPEQRTSKLWRAFDGVEATIVTVELAGSPAEAQRVAHGMYAVWNEVVGSYVVAGPHMEGTSTRGEENVEAVADCLRAGSPR